MPLPSPGLPAVSRQTLAESPRRKYVSPARRHRAERSRQALIDAVLGFARKGNFRPTTAEITRRAGCSSSAITRHFGALDVLYRCVAREQSRAVMQAAGFDVDRSREADLAWLIMVGQPRGMP